ncbi:45303_t:CDS:2, partial [Gigaspora margarita]
IHGEQKCPLGKIDEFSITADGKTITSQAVISEAKNYTVIIGSKSLIRLGRMKEKSNKKKGKIDEYSSKDEIN